MRTVLVCVRTPIAVQTIATCASRLGIAAMVRTALTPTEAVAKLAADPADIVLADTALARPDAASFTTRVLGVAPGAALVLFGPTEPRSAAAAVAAGARGVIRGDGSDPVTLVAKALLLLLGQAGKGATDRSSRHQVSRSAMAPPTARPGPTNGSAAAAAGTGQAPAAGAVPQVTGRSTGAPARVIPGHGVPQQRADAVSDVPRRRVELTERELQVLRGMAEGKSNAEIGRDLYVSEDTVKTHARRLFRKLGARDRAHAVASAFRAGLVS